MLEQEGGSLKIIAEDAEVKVNYTSLAILSPFFRGLMTSLPTCCSPLHLSLPGTTASSVKLFFSLLADGTTKEVNSLRCHLSNPNQNFFIYIILYQNMNNI